MSEKESILKKIQKLLKMSEENGASENEAMTAAQKVNELLQEHNLSMSDINTDDSVVEPIDKESFDIPRDKWKGWVTAATAKLYFCTTYNESRVDENYKTVKVRTFVGRESNRKVAKSMCDYFINAVERMADKEFATVPGSRSDINKMKFNFKQGAAMSLCNRLNEKYKSINGPDIYSGIDNPNNLPKLYKDEDQNNRNWLAKQGINLRSSTASISVKDRVAFANGKAKGNNIGIDTQVNANKGKYLSA